MYVAKKKYIDKTTKRRTYNHARRDYSKSKDRAKRREMCLDLANAYVQHHSRSYGRPFRCTPVPTQITILLNKYFSGF